MATLASRLDRFQERLSALSKPVHSFPLLQPRFPEQTLSLSSSLPASMNMSALLPTLSTPPDSMLEPSPHFALLSVPQLFNVLSTAKHPLARLSRDPLPEDSVSFLQRIQSEAIVTMRSIWAHNTWSQRISLQERLEAFRKEHQLDSDSSDLALDWSIVLFATSTNTLPSSKMTYVKSLAALYRRQDHELPLCSLFTTALRATATIPTHQAVPATVELVDRALQLASTNTRLQLAIWLCFKTASRADEVFRLTSKSFLVNNPEEIIIEWMGNTKTTRLDPWRTSSWVAIHHHAPMSHFNKIISDLAQDPEATLMETPTSTLTSWLSRDNKTRTLSAQSFKRGALTILAQMAIGGQLDLSLIPRLAKHKVEFDIFPATTLRYLGDKVILAKLLRTQEATMLIPCFHHPTNQNILSLMPNPVPPSSTPASRPATPNRTRSPSPEATAEATDRFPDARTRVLRARISEASSMGGRLLARRTLRRHIELLSHRTDSEQATAPLYLRNRRQ
jgi:hypothetical protein